MNQPLKNEKHEAMAQRIASKEIKPSGLPKTLSDANRDLITDRAFDLSNDDGKITMGGGFKAIAPNLIGTIRDRQIIVAQDLQITKDLIEEFGSDPKTMGYANTAASAMINSIKKMISNCCSHDAYGITRASVKDQHPDLIEAITKMIDAADAGSDSKNRKTGFGSEIEAIKMLIASGPGAK